MAAPPEEAERAVIGSMLIDASAADKARLALDPEDFWVEEHREIFAAACALRDEQQPVDTVTVIERLRLSDRLAAAGGADRVLGALNAVSTSAHMPFYIKIVRQASLQRQFDTQVKIVYNEQTPANVQRLDDLLMQIHGEGVGRIVDFKSDDINEIVEAILSKPVQGYQTGFFNLDNALNRLEPGDLVTIGARTSGGKTAMMVQTMVNMAKAGVRCLYLTTEMDDVQLVKRILPGFSKVPAFRFRGGDLTDFEKEAVRRASYGGLHGLPIKIMAKPRMSLKDIRGALVKSDCQVAFFDYLQRAKFPKAESRVYEIEEFMVGLKTLARSMDKTIVTAVQLDRQLDKNPTLPPKLADLRGSGAIEAESDTVILLWRPPDIVANKRVDWVPPSDGCIAIEANVEKNRHGPAPATIDLELNGQMVQMAERAESRAKNDGHDDEEAGSEWYK